jgi:Na+/melibiose symporter-like transporter
VDHWHLFPDQSEHFLYSSDNIALIFALNILFLFVFNTTTPLQWLMASDVVDYEEESGRRLDGWSSTYLFSLKIGLAIGGALVGWILAFSSYSASNAVQPDNVLTTIKILFCIVPVVYVRHVYAAVVLQTEQQTGGRDQPATATSTRCAPCNAACRCRGGGELRRNHVPD